MRPWPIIAEAAAAGALAGSGVGVIELVWLLVAGQPFDGLAAAWAWGLYGLVGAGLATVAGVLLGLLALKWARLSSLAAAGGAVSAFSGLWWVVGPYLLHRDLFHEQGIPGWGWGLVALISLLPTPALVSAWSSERTTIASFRPALGLGAPWLVIGLVLALGPLARPPLAVQPPPEPAAVPEGPGVLLILVDTLRADVVSDPGEHLPALSSLKADSVAFQQAWSASSWTRPSVATLLTSRLPSGHNTSTKSSRLPGSLTTIAEQIGEGGLPSKALVNNPNITASFGFDQGFSQFSYLEPSFPLGANEAVFGLSLYKLLHRLDARLVPNAPVSRAYQPAQVVLEQALPWIEAYQGRRQLTLVHLMEPHDPYFEHEILADGTVRSSGGFARATHPRPDPDQAGDLKRRYLGEIEHLDRQLGAFLDELRAKGLYDDLYIVLTSDHGEEFYEHGGWWHGDSLHREQTQVPLWIKLPHGQHGGRTPAWSVRLLDVAPTLARALGVEPHESWEGLDLLGADELEALQPQPESARDLSRVDPATACRDGRSHALDRLVIHEENFEGNLLWGVRHQRMAWLRAAPQSRRAWPERALFDTVGDPSERLDLLSHGESICSQLPQDWAAELESMLARSREASARGAPPALDVDLTEAERQRLCALGYLSGPECQR